MASAGPDLNFSVSELQQAGLLEAANIQQDDIFGPSLGTTSSASGNSSLDGSGGTQGRTGTETGPAARGSLHRRNEASSSAPERLADSQKETRALQGNYQIEPSSKKQAANRENQKRWRAKQKAQKQAVEAQLAFAAAELQQMKRRQQELEQLLRQAHTDTSLAQDDSKAQDPKASADPEQPPPLTISIQPNSLQLSATEIMDMPAQEFQALWAAYVHEMANCLVLLDQHPDPGIEQRLHEVTFEAVRLRGASLGQKPDGKKSSSYLSQNHPHYGTSKLAPFYSHLVSTLQLSVSQVNDLMLVRQLYVTKRQLASQKRAQLMAQLQEEDLNPIDDAVNVAELGAELQKNACEEHRMLHSVAIVIYCGIMTMTQAAIIMVQCHPHRPCPANFFDAVASEKGPLGPPRLLSDADNNALSNVLAAYWQYYQLVDPDKGCHVDHVPFIGSQSASLAPQFSLY